MKKDYFNYYDGEKYIEVKTTKEIEQGLQEVMREQWNFEYASRTHEITVSTEVDIFKRDTLSLDEQVEKAEIAANVQNAIAKLTPYQQKIVELLFYENISKAEVGRRLGVSKQTIQTLEKRILEKLKNFL